ncbi:MAG: hypothetical protein KJN84_05495, partial [Bacteroidia bacterium]|nr:hypothetical protein [Bacteroidia bacterium]
SLENHLEIKSQYSSQIDTIKSTVSSAHKQNGSNQKKKTLISIIALIALALLLYFIFFNKVQNTNDYFAEYIDHYPIEIQTKGQTFDDLYKKGMTEYNSKNYSEAIQTLENINMSIPSDGQLAIALSHLQIGNLKNSQTIFERLSGNPIYKDLSLWYIALINVKNENFDEAISKLKSIDPNSQKYKSAQSLLNKLQ